LDNIQRNNKLRNRCLCLHSWPKYREIFLINWFKGNKEKERKREERKQEERKQEERKQEEIDKTFYLIYTV
jgi:hypothetical protein